MNHEELAGFSYDSDKNARRAPEDPEGASLFPKVQGSHLDLSLNVIYITAAVLLLVTRGADSPANFAFLDSPIPRSAPSLVRIRTDVVRK